MVAMGLAAETRFDEAVVVTAVVTDDDELAGVGTAAVVDDIALLAAEGIAAVVAAAAATGTVPLLFVAIVLIIDEIGVVVLTGGAAGLKGVFCFCILYIRLGQSVTRISRPNISFPRQKEREALVRETTGGVVCTAEIVDCHLRRIRIDERDRCFAFPFARLSIFVDPDLWFG